MNLAASVDIPSWEKIFCTVQRKACGMGVFLNVSKVKRNDSMDIINDYSADEFKWRTPFTSIIGYSLRPETQYHIPFAYGIITFIETSTNRIYINRIP